MKAEKESALPPFSKDSASLIKKHLSQEIYTDLKDLRTATGFSLDQAIRSGVALPESSVGIYAGDPESYTLFSRIFDPIIRDYHGLGPQKGHTEAMVRVKDLPPLDPEGDFIRSVRIRVARNLAGFPFCCHLTRSQRLAVEKMAIRAFDLLPIPFTGTYLSFAQTDENTLSDLVREKLAFPKGDRFQEAAGMNQDFPAGRGIFLSHSRTFRVWVNEEDHLRLMVMNQGGDLAGTFNTLVKALDWISDCLCFSYDPDLGYLNACPTNLGTAMRAGAHVRLPRLGACPDRLKDLVRRHHLQVRGTGGEKTAVEDAVFDISNARRLGPGASRIIEDLYQGIDALIAAEKNL